MKPQDAPIFERLTDAQLVALTVYMEARNQPVDAQVGIAWVIMLRVAHPSWMGKTVHEVVLKPNQFSEYNSNDPEYGPSVAVARDWDGRYEADKALKVAEGVAAGVLSGHIPNPFGRDDVLYFREEHVHPDYEARQTMVAKWGTTTFWVDKKRPVEACNKEGNMLAGIVIGIMAVVAAIVYYEVRHAYFVRKIAAAKEVTATARQTVDAIEAAVGQAKKG